ncbi:MAG: hypothetical protein HC831_03555 [Chloroflexia bacterium]|nr:hypothetical protein [Chloroflexia bacterium]
MKAIKLFLFTVLFQPYLVMGQESRVELKDYWQLGLGLGELPVKGSFKPSITIGYHFNNKLYAGFIYQLNDKIQRNGTSFNMQSAELDGLVSSKESVARRFMMHVKYTPVWHGPYLSFGFVFNGKDTETMLFDSRYRELSGEDYNGSIEIRQTRPKGWGLALGLGYQYNFRNGFSAGFEWTPAWGQYPTPLYEFGGSSYLSDPVKSKLQKKMDDGFKSSVTNVYKVFHIGLVYRIKSYL